MILAWTRLCETIEADGVATLASIVAVAGSSPRDPGARVVVRRDGGFWGSVGGGQLEWRLIEDARTSLAAGRGAALVRDWPLGPELGQCCGGRVTTCVEVFDRRDIEEVRALAARERDGAFELTAWIGPDGRVRRAEAAPPGTRLSWTERFGDDRHPVLLFGAGHVGRALALALAPLPFRLRWVDSRPDAFPALVPANAEPVLVADPTAEVAGAPAGADVLVMTHSHPLDLAVVEAALRRADLGHVGLIGSATKKARFMARLRAAGLGEAAQRRLVCPIGVPGITGKEPAVIAVAVAAQLLQWHNGSVARRPAPAAPLRLAGARR